MVKEWCLVLLFYVFQLSDAHPDICQDAKIDTITRVKDGSTYVFKEDSYWKVLSNGSVENGYPRYISGDWDSLVGHLDASVTLDTGDTYFFKDDLYARFTDKNKYDDFNPRPINEEFQNAPTYMNAAFVWGKNGKVYFFRGDHYFRIDSGDPAPITAWSSELAGGIDAALQWENGITYFFKGDKYYRYDDETEGIAYNDPPYPLSTAKYWFNCP